MSDYEKFDESNVDELVKMYGIFNTGLSIGRPDFTDLEIACAMIEFVVQCGSGDWHSFCREAMEESIAKEMNE